MTVKQLRRILAKLPDDTSVCRTSGEDGCELLGEARYCPQFGILYLEPYWMRSRTSNINMDQSARSKGSPKLDKFTLHQIHKYAEEGKRIVDAKQDGKMHHIKIIASMWDEFLFGGRLKHHEWLSLVVDDTREGGGKLGVGSQCVICEFDWESIQIQKGEEE
jgi:hypothetical protein